MICLRQLGSKDVSVTIIINPTRDRDSFENLQISTSEWQTSQEVKRIGVSVLNQHNYLWTTKLVGGEPIYKDFIVFLTINASFRTFSWEHRKNNDGSCIIHKYSSSENHKAVISFTKNNSEKTNYWETYFGR